MQIVDEYLSYLLYQKKNSPHTVTAYQKDLEQYVKYVGGETGRLAGVSRSEVRSWLLSMLRGGMSDATVHRKMSALKSFYSYMQKQGVVQKSPVDAISLPKKKKRLPVFLKEIQTNKLFEEVEFAEGFLGVRDRLILKMFYLTGLRVSELVDVKEESLTKDSLKVLGKGSKERIVPLLPSLVIEIKRYIMEKNKAVGYGSYLFVSEKNQQMNRSQVYYIVKKYMGEVTSAVKRSPHVLRHTFATQLMNSGADINALKELLGHSSLAATQVYTHATVRKLKSDYKKCHPRGGN